MKEKELDTILDSNNPDIKKVGDLNREIKA
jgi:hypothetical protein